MSHLSRKHTPRRIPPATRQGIQKRMPRVLNALAMQGIEADMRWIAERVPEAQKDALVIAEAMSALRSGAATNLDQIIQQRLSQ